jgi:hypothetical protein
MLWSKVLYDWYNGKILKYPEELKEKFMWNTSVLKNNGNCKFIQKFKINNELPLIHDESVFNEYFIRSKNKYVVAFYNLNKDAILVVPKPVNGKNYATLKDFIDNAPEIQQHKFWKKVSKLAIRFMNKKGKVWISVSGLGVAYTHLRISTIPKYYFDENLMKE